MEETGEMIRNTRISLEKDSEKRIDAKSVIKYTLLLDYKIPKICKEDTWITDVMQCCQECCRGLFEDYQRGGKEYNFFGKYKKEQKSPLGYLDQGDKRSHIFEDRNQPRFHDMILHHCVIAAYHAILTDLVGEDTITHYDLVNNMAGTKYSRGLNYLIKNEIYSLNTRKIKTNTNNGRSNKEKSRMASDFEKTSHTHKQVLSRYDLWGMDDKNIPIQFADLLFRICKIPAPKWHIFSNSKTDYIGRVQELDKMLIERFSNLESPLEHTGFHGNDVDWLYANYLMERTFNISLFYSLLSHIDQIEKEQIPFFGNQEIMDVLLTCSKLPNSFSRQVFINYAIGNIWDKPESSHDFWSEHDLEQSDIAVKKIRKERSGFLLPVWVEQFKLFMNYMSEYVIPIYEWCFVCMLMESIEGKYQGENHKMHLTRALDLLADYMIGQKDAIVRPVKFKKEEGKLFFSEDVSSVLIQHNRFETFRDINAQTIEQLVKGLFRVKDERDLNLKPLNAKFFVKDGTNMPKGTNHRRIQDFYIEFVKYTYLQ